MGAELLPEEEEFERAQSEGPGADADETTQRLRELLALSFGVVIIMAVTIPVLLVLYALTRSVLFLVLDLVFIAMAIGSFVYLRYRMSQLTMRL